MARPRCVAKSRQPDRLRYGSSSATTITACAAPSAQQMRFRLNKKRRLVNLVSDVFDRANTNNTNVGARRTLLCYALPKTSEAHPHKFRRTFELCSFKNRPPPYQTARLSVFPRASTQCWKAAHSYILRFPIVVRSIFNTCSCTYSGCRDRPLLC